MSEDDSFVFRRRLLPTKGPYTSSYNDESGGIPKDIVRRRALRPKVRGALNDWASRLGEQYVHRQTNDINNVGPGLIGTFELIPGVRLTPDSIDLSIGWPPVIGDVKVGTFGDYEQAEELATAVEKGMARPGIIYMLESPITGKSRMPAWISSVLIRTGFDFIYFRGPWWDCLQESEPQEDSNTHRQDLTR